MSQHLFRVNDRTECMVGWDPPLQTFFGQVYRIGEDGCRVEDEMEDGTDATILWIGGELGAVRSVDELERKLKPHTTLPADVREKLFSEEVD